MAARVYNGCETKTDMYDRIPGDGEMILCMGNNSAGDIPVSLWQYSASSNAADNYSGGVIKPTLQTGNGRWLRQNNYPEIPSMSGQSGKFLTNNGSISSWSNLPSPATSNASVYAAGTAYNLTTTMQAVTFGTTSPVVTIPASGTYLILSNIKLGYAGVTSIANRTISLKLRRNNNTPADVANSNTSFVVPIIGTALTGTAGDCDVPAILYTTANTNDQIELQGNISAALSLGNAQVQEASIVAIKLY